jgi:hypothetical protein
MADLPKTELKTSQEDEDTSESDTRYPGMDAETKGQYRKEQQGLEKLEEPRRGEGVEKGGKRKMGRLKPGVGNFSEPDEIAAEEEKKTG